VADDAGALLVRSGLVSSTALDEARSQVAEVGGTIGEQLVAAGVIKDDALTEFYKTRLLVPQVNPNTLARLPAKVVATIPSDMAIELRAIPVSLDADNNLTVAMSDPSDRHAVDEIAFFSSAYVVRAVATQMQIAWCLAHYYGHVTQLGQRLLGPSSASTSGRAAAQAAVRPSRPRGLTGEVNAQRKRAMVPVQAGPADDAVPQPVPAPEDPRRARSVSGEIRVPGRRAPSIRPPLPEDSNPVITLEADEPEIEIKAEVPAKPVRKRPAEPDPPELAARAGELRSRVAGDQRPATEVPSDEPRIVIADDLTTPPELSARTGEVRVREHRDELPAEPSVSVEIEDEPSAPVVIHSIAPDKSEPVLLDRRRNSDAPTNVAVTPAPAAPGDADDDDDEVVELAAPKPAAKRAPTQRPERNTQVGIGIVRAVTRSKHDTTEAVPAEVEDAPTASRRGVDNDPTRVDTQAAPPGDYTSSSDEIIAPPAPDGDEVTSPHAIPPLPSLEPPGPSGKVTLDGVKRAPSRHDDEEDDGLAAGPATTVMTAVDLDKLMPGGTTNDYDPLDEGWGPPGTTIPPPLLGAVPGTITPASGIIPISSIDTPPLLVAPPAPPEQSGRSSSASDTGLLAALEDATSQMLELIRHLERAGERDHVVEAMMEHLASSHRRAGFFAARAGELQLFAITPRPEMIPYATLRLDRPSTLQDVVGTRLPYRGPMHDDASRTFLAASLGACPPEILLVPITVRERVVGVLFGEHRLRHTFDDQLALAARAAGNALERILKARRG
jgi:hypothetical protein